MIKKTILVVTILIGIGVCANSVNAKVHRTVSPSKINSMARQKYKSYVNKYNKHYLGFNACLENMRHHGGGTLVVKKGTYKICNAICVPSNVKIIFKNGVRFKKTNKVGAGKPKAAKSMWQVVPKNKFDRKRSVGRYKGSHNVKMIAKGKVVFDMKNKMGMCIVVAHARNVEIKGITFKGQNGGHYVEISGSKKVRIHHNKFTKSKAKTKSKYYNKEALNIDTPDKKTHGLPLNWAKQDLTPCVNINIYRNKFSGTTRGIGTHKYSRKRGKQVYHKNIKITNNSFYNIYDNGIFVMSWKNTKIMSNKFNKIGKHNKHGYSSGSHGISGGGVNGIRIYKNKFTNIKRNPIYFYRQKNTGPGKSYKKVVVKITKKQLKLMSKNKAKKCGKDIYYRYGRYHALIFKGNGSRSYDNACGVRFGKSKIHRGFWY